MTYTMGFGDLGFSKLGFGDFGFGEMVRNRGVTIGRVQQSTALRFSYWPFCYHTVTLRKSFT